MPSQTGYLYDGDGRVIKQVAYALGAQTWETDMTYGGNYVTVVPPSGGTSDTTFTDGRGLTTAIYQYHAGVPASPSDPPSQYDQTSYTYTPAQKLASIKDAASNSWSYTYDLLGNQLTATDPDAGATTNTYDAASQLMTVTDSRNKQVSYTYDGDGRKTAEYDTTGGAPRKHFGPAGVLDLGHAGQGTAHLLHVLLRRGLVYRGGHRLQRLRTAVGRAERHTGRAGRPGRHLHAARQLRSRRAADLLHRLGCWRPARRDGHRRLRFRRARRTH